MANNKGEKQSMDWVTAPATLPLKWSMVSGVIGGVSWAFLVGWGFNLVAMGEFREIVSVGPAVVAIVGAIAGGIAAPTFVKRFFGNRDLSKLIVVVISGLIGFLVIPAIVLILVIFVSC